MPRFSHRNKEAPRFVCQFKKKEPNGFKMRLLIKNSGSKLWSMERQNVCKSEPVVLRAREFSHQPFVLNNYLQIALYRLQFLYYHPLRRKFSGVVVFRWKFYSSVRHHNSTVRFEDGARLYQLYAHLRKLSFWSS